MLKVNLTELRTEGTLAVDERIPPEAALWEGFDLSFRAALTARLQVSLTGSGQILVRGQLLGRLLRICRRCTKEVVVEVAEGLDLLYLPPDELGGEPEEGVRELPPGQVELDLSEAVREEVILAAPMYTVCSEDCRGLCPGCGIDRNESTCDCTFEEPDPRWDALRALKEE